MRVLGFSIPLFVLLIGAYILGAMYPGLWSKAKSTASSVASAA